MARKKGDFNFSANFEVKKKTTLDARQYVDSYSELFEFTADDYIPYGFPVTVGGLGDFSKLGTWFCVDPNNLSNPLSWVRSNQPIPFNQVIQVGSYSFNNTTFVATLGATLSWAFNENGINYILGNTAVTLTAPNATLPRADIIVWSTALGYQSVQGVAAADFAIPNPPAGKILVQTIIRNVDGSTQSTPPDLSNYAKLNSDNRFAAKNTFESVVTFDNTALNNGLLFTSNGQYNGNIKYERTTGNLSFNFYEPITQALQSAFSVNRISKLVTYSGRVKGLPASEADDFVTKAQSDLKVDKAASKSLIADTEIARLLNVFNFDNSGNVTALGNKVDKITGKSLSTNDFTTIDKTKLDSLSNYKGFRGAQSSLANIITAYPTGVLGDWGIITNATGNAYFAIWDTDIPGWIESGQSPTIPGTNLAFTVVGNTLTVTSDSGNDVALPLATTTAAGLQSLEDKTKLNGIAVEATKNQTDAFLLARGNHTGSQLAATISDFNTAALAAAPAETVASIGVVANAATAKPTLVDADTATGNNSVGNGLIKTTWLNVYAYIKAKTDLVYAIFPTADGIYVRTGAGTVASRTIVGTTNQVTVVNGNGVAGNPTLNLPQDIHTGATPQFARIGLGMASVASAFSAIAASTAAIASFLITFGATYTGTVEGSTWAETVGTRLRMLRGGIASDFLFSLNNFLYKGTGNRIGVFNAAGDLMATDMLDETCVVDTQIITTIKAGTYVNGEANITTAMAAISKTFFQGQSYYDSVTKIRYNAVDDNIVTIEGRSTVLDEKKNFTKEVFVLSVLEIIFPMQLAGQITAITASAAMSGLQFKVGAGGTYANFTTAFNYAANAEIYVTWTYISQTETRGWIRLTGKDN